MRTEIENDRIRLTAENEDENEAIRSIEHLFWATGFDDNSLTNEGVCGDFGWDRDVGFNYCCIPLPDDCEAHALKTGHLIMEPTHSITSRTLVPRQPMF
jgi:hypothetical protein